MIAGDDQENQVKSEKATLAETFQQVSDKDKLVKAYIKTKELEADDKSNNRSIKNALPSIKRILFFINQEKKKKKCKN